MEQLFEKYRKKIALIQTSFVRSIMSEINWDARLIGIKGARGVGKTTLLLQYIKLHLMEEVQAALYVSLDNIWFSENKLVDLGNSFSDKTLTTFYNLLTNRVLSIFQRANRSISYPLRRSN